MALAEPRVPYELSNSVECNEHHRIFLIWDHLQCSRFCRSHGLPRYAQLSTFPPPPLLFFQKRKVYVSADQLPMRRSTSVLPACLGGIVARPVYELLQVPTRRTSADVFRLRAARRDLPDGAAVAVDVRCVRPELSPRFLWAGLDQQRALL